MQILEAWSDIHSDKDLRTFYCVSLINVKLDPSQFLEIC